MNVGKNTIITDANMPDQSPEYFIDCIIEYRPTATGLTLSPLAKIKERKYSFHMFIKQNILKVTIPGCASGNIIFQKVFIGEHPSIAAASSYVVDRVAKKLSRKITAKGILIPEYRKIIKIRVFMSLSNMLMPAINEKSGRIIITTGTPIAATNPLLITLFAINLNLESTYDAGAATNIKSMVEIVE